MTGPEEELAPEPAGGVGAVALAWLSAGDYEQATMLWPDFARSDRVAGPDGPLPHPRIAERCSTYLSSTPKPACP